jgi:hypothetical protein
VIAIASYRPLDDSEEVARNQIRAIESWNHVFDLNILLGPTDGRLFSPTTVFMPCADFPAIRFMVYVAFHQLGWSCLINADIVVLPSLKMAIRAAETQGAVALTSHRYEFNPDYTDYRSAKVKDNGVDFFAARDWVWWEVFKIIPAEFRIGHCAWDSWMLGALNKIGKKRFVDITSARCIFHPKHGDRKRAYDVHVPEESFVGSAGFPSKRL